MAKTILIVDDDPTQRRLMQAVVEKQNFTAAHADSGEAALQALSSVGNIDVILLDLVMPGMGGMKALTEIRARVPHVPVIVLTGQGGIDTVVKAMQAGAADFFVKPVSPERLVVSLRNVLKVGELEGEVVRLRKTANGALTLRDMHADAPPM
ncbi:Response regulatory protein, partial [hydrothermal vent metagenome]